MKSVKEIKDFKDRYRHMAINPQNTQEVNQFVFDVLIGIAEHLEADKTDAYMRGIEFAKQLTPEDFASASGHQSGWVQGNRAAIAEMRVIIDKIEESMRRIEGEVQP